jgi:hypothetical protein
MGREELDPANPRRKHYSPLKAHDTDHDINAATEPRSSDEPPSESWREDGLLHRLGGPAAIWRDSATGAARPHSRSRLRRRGRPAACQGRLSQHHAVDGGGRPALANLKPNGIDLLVSKHEHVSGS